jgi:hypothetical protein
LASFLALSMTTRSSVSVSFGMAVSLFIRRMIDRTTGQRPRQRHAVAMETTA